MKKLRLNRFDILLLVIAAALIAGTCLKFLVLDQTAAPAKATGEVTYQMKIQGVRQYTVDALRTGDTVYDDAGKASIGVITDVSAGPAEAQITGSDGTAVVGTMEDKYDVVLTITAQGTLTDSAFEVGSYDLYVNTSGTFYTKYCIWTGTILSIG